MAVDRTRLLRELAQRLFRQSYKDVTATASGSTVSILRSDDLYAAGASSAAYNGGWLYVHAGVGAGTERRIVSVNPTVADFYGEATLARPLSGAPDATTQGFVYTGPLSPTQLKACLNEALRRMRRERRLGLTLVTDGNMEATGTASWTATSASLSKVTGAGDVAEGAQALLVDNSGVDGQAASAAIPAVPGERLLVEAVVRVGNTTGAHTATLRVVDGAGALLASAATDNRERTVLRAEVGVPAGVVQVAVQLRGSAAATDAYWDQVLLWRPHARQVALPTDLTDSEQLIQVVQRRASPGELVARARFPRVVGAVVVPDPLGATALALDLSAAGDLTSPVFADCLLPWPELATDAATTAADLDNVLLRSRLTAYERLTEGGSREENAAYKEQAQKLRVAAMQESAYGPRPAIPVGRRKRTP